MVGTPSSSNFYAAKLDGHAAVNSSVFSFGARGFTLGRLGSNSRGYRFGNWQPGNTAFVGLALFSSSGSNPPNLGWAEIHLGPNYDPTLIAWGYDTEPGETAFTPPAVPEPSSLLLLASGAAGLEAYRRRRTQRRAAAAI